MGLDPEGESTLRVWVRRLQQIFVGYMQTTPDVHQIRFIALNDRGRELVRVERRNDRVTVEPSLRLQIQGAPPYVTETLKLGPGGVFVSDFDLYRENGTVLFPHRPTVRYSTPVFNDDGRPVGLIIINVDRGTAVREFPGRTPPGAFLILTNAAGDYVLHPDRSLEFGFDLGQITQQAHVDAKHRNRRAVQHRDRTQHGSVPADTQNQFSRRDIGSREVGLLAHTSDPHDNTPQHSNKELSARDEPVGVDHVRCLLIVDIVEGIAGVPGYNQANLD